MAAPDLFGDRHIVQVIEEPDIEQGWSWWTWRCSCETGAPPVRLFSARSVAEARAEHHVSEEARP